MQAVSKQYEPPSRDDAMSTATHLITNLLRCVLWLIRHGIYVNGFSGERDTGGGTRITVRVAASPYIYQVLKGEAAWQQRRQQGHLTIFTWFAVRFGIRIEWEEVCVTSAR